MKKQRLSKIRNIVALGVPLLAGNLSHYLLQVADTAMVGRLGTAQLSSIALAGLFSGILYCIVWPVSLGCQAIAARRFGRLTADSLGPARSTGEVLDNAMVMGLVLGVVGILLSLTAKPVLSLMVGNEAIVSGALSYIRIIRWQLPILGIASACTGFLAAINRTKPIMAGTIAGNVLNIGFNYVFIYGAFGLPALGIRGAAAGTLLAEFLTILYFIAIVSGGKNRGLHDCFRFRSLSFRLMKDIFKVAAPPMIQNSLAVGIFLVYESIVGRLGMVYLAVTHIVFSMFRINKTIVGGFARGGAILVGNLLGKKDKENAKAYVVSCEMLAAAIGSVIFVCVMSFPGLVVHIFTSDGATVGLGVKALRFFAPFFFIEILSYSFEIIFTNNGFGKLVLVSEFSTNVVCILFLSWLLTSVFGFGVYSAWLSFGLYQIFHALILFAGFLSNKWQYVEVETERVI